MSLYFTYETRGSLKLFKATTRLNLEYIDKFSIEKFKELSRRGSRSPDNAEFGHFTLLFHRGRQRNVQKIISHLNSHCSPHYTFCLATFPLPSWFSFKLSNDGRVSREGAGKFYPDSPDRRRWRQKTTGNESNTVTTLIF